ncbi:hypothetical protein ACFHW2_11545 [Actinomadura sp. LOL_016]|uniref:hypothetical protein n=1 Tax=unclassified Actinomadura TaxID=2626254 RepID=UPI003A808D78
MDAHWPPQEGDVWGCDGSTVTWHAVHVTNHELPADESEYVVLVCSSSDEGAPHWMRPDDVERLNGPLALRYRAAAAQPTAAERVESLIVSTMDEAESIGTPGPLPAEQLDEIRKRAALQVDEGNSIYEHRVYAEDVPALLAEVQRLRAELDEEKHRHTESVDSAAQVLNRSAKANMRVRLAWLSARRGRAEERQRADALHAEREQLRARLDDAWTVVREGTANERAARAAISAERDAARTEAGRYRAAHRAVRRRSALRGAKVKRLRGELATARRRRKDGHKIVDLLRGEQKQLRAELEVHRAANPLKALAITRIVQGLTVLVRVERDEALKRAEEAEADRAAIESVIAAWECGGAHPGDARDALTAIRVRLDGHAQADGEEAGRG